MLSTLRVVGFLISVGLASGAYCDHASAQGDDCRNHLYSNIRVRIVGTNIIHISRDGKNWAVDRLHGSITCSGVALGEDFAIVRYGENADILRFYGYVLITQLGKTFYALDAFSDTKYIPMFVSYIHGPNAHIPSGEVHLVRGGAQQRYCWHNERWYASPLSKELLACSSKPLSNVTKRLKHRRRVVKDDD